MRGLRSDLLRKESTFACCPLKFKLRSELNLSPAFGSASKAKLAGTGNKAKIAILHRHCL